MGSQNELKPGLTWRVVLAILLAGLLFLPVSIYMNLVAGAVVGTAAIYVIAIIFSEFSRMFGSRLTRQELFLIYATVGGVASTIPVYYWLVYRSFFVTSPFIREFRIEGVDLIKLVPSWLAPPPPSPVHHIRTLMHPDWLPAVLVYTFTSVLGFLAEVSLAMMFSHLFIEVERLPFPFAHVDAALINTLSGREAERIRLFSLSMLFGAVAAALIYVPYILGVPLVPLPWVDLTRFTEPYLPGAVVGLVADPSAAVGGFMLPPSVTGSALLGSLLVWTIANTLILTQFKWIAPEWVEEYQRGMGIALLYQRSNLRIWMAFQFGVVVGFSIALAFLMWRSIVRAVRFLMSPPPEYSRGMGLPPLKFLLSVYLASTSISVAVFTILVPGYPLIIPILMSIGYSFLISMLACRAVGELGVFPQLPWPWQVITYFTPYRGFAGWVFSPYISFGGNSGMVSATKVALLTGTRPIDYYKALSIGFMVSLALGFLYMDFFWRLAPIPSTVYPFTLIYWPTFMMNDALFATRQVVIRSSIVCGGAVTAAVAACLGAVLSKVGIPFSPVAFITGFFLLPPSLITTFLGSLIGNYAMSRVMGRERWNEVRGIIVAGYFVGSSLVIGMGLSITLLARSTWIWPW